MDRDIAAFLSFFGLEPFVRVWRRNRMDPLLSVVDLANAGIDDGAVRACRVAAR